MCGIIVGRGPLYKKCHRFFFKYDTDMTKSGLNKQKPIRIGRCICAYTGHPQYKSDP